MQKHSFITRISMGVASVVVGLSTATLSYGNIVGNGTQNFSPANGTHDFTTVQSSRVLGPKSYGLGLFFNHARNTLPYSKDHDGADQSNGVSSADLMLSVGLTKRFELGLIVPFVMHQSVDDRYTRGEFAKEGNTEIRGTAKLNVYENGGFGLALLGTLGYDRLVANPHAGRGESLSYILEVAPDYTWQAWRVALNLGYKITPQGEEVDDSLVTPSENAALASLALSYKIPSTKSQVVAETFMSSLAEPARNDTNRSANATEALVGYRYQTAQDSHIHAGLGSQLGKGFATPSMRLYVGINHVLRAQEKVQAPRISKKRAPRRKARPAPRMAAVQPLPPIEYNEPAPMPEPLPDYGTAFTEPVQHHIPQRAPDQAFTLNNVNFVFDSHSVLLRGGLNDINNLVQHLQTNQIEKLVIEGHTCTMGSDAYNKDLSFRRAQSIRAHLIRHHGFSPEQIVAVGFGMQTPAADNRTETGRMMNRRVEFKIFNVGH